MKNSTLWRWMIGGPVLMVAIVFTALFLKTAFDMAAGKKPGQLLYVDQRAGNARVDGWDKLNDASRRLCCVSAWGQLDDTHPGIFHVAIYDFDSGRQVAWAQQDGCHAP